MHKDGLQVKRAMIWCWYREEMLDYILMVRVVRGMEQGFSDQLIVLGKVRLMGIRIKRRKVMKDDIRFRSKKLREHQYRSIC